VSTVIIASYKPVLEEVQRILAEAEEETTQAGMATSEKGSGDLVDHNRR
jgi:hypothetical protein